jgi:hypothetical protein
MGKFVQKKLSILMKSISALASIILLSWSLYAQQLQMPLDQTYQYRLDRYLHRTDANFHTSMRPYLESEVLRNLPKDSWEEMGVPAYNAYFSPQDSVRDQDYRAGFVAGLKRGDFLQFHGNKAYLGINPIVDFVAGYDIGQEQTLLSGQYGANLNAHFGKKFSLGFTYRGISERPMDYIRDQALEREVLPGFGKATFNDEVIRANDFNGYVSFTPSKYFNMQAGYGRHFWGDGYRSLLLSDHAPSYPYLSLNTNFWKIKYSFLFNVMQDGRPTEVPGQFDFGKKYGVFHMLSVNVTDWFQFGFFEGVVWEDGDSTGRRGIDVNYLNPVVFFRPVEFALGSPDNITLGINLKFKAKDKAVIYAQFMLDDLDIQKNRISKGFYRNKFAIQAGIKTFDLLSVPFLDAQVEMNMVRPYMYAHKTPEQNYTHMNMPLAHPLGANFMELAAILRYQKNRYYGAAKVTYAIQGRDRPGEHNGSNIFISDFEIAPNLDFAFGNSFLQGVRTKIMNVEVRGGYILNPRLNLSAEAIFNYRKLSSDMADQQNIFFGVGVRSNIFNRYRDF